MFAKEMKLIFPNSQRINRGNYQVKQLVDACRTNECTDLIILHETRGTPGNYKDMARLYLSIIHFFILYKMPFKFVIYHTGRLLILHYLMY